MKRNLQATAKAFQAEGKVSSDPVGMHFSASCVKQLFFLWVLALLFSFFLSRIYYLLPVKNVFFAAIDAPGGFLFEWWSVFWDIFIARTNEKHSDVAASYIEVSVYAFSCLFMNNFYLLHGCLTCLLLFLSPSTNSKFFCAWVLVHLESERMPVWTRGFFSRLEN